jgi:hypothetical protein
MIRTKFYGRRNVISLRDERKHRRLLKRRAERDQAQPTDYRIGLMICLDQIELDRADKALCDRLRAIQRGYNTTVSDMRALHELIGRLMYDPAALTIHRVALGDIEDDGSKVAAA